MGDIMTKIKTVSLVAGLALVVVAGETPPHPPAHARAGGRRDGNGAGGHRHDDDWRDCTGCRRGGCHGHRTRGDRHDRSCDWRCGDHDHHGFDHDEAVNPTVSRTDGPPLQNGGPSYIRLSAWSRRQE